MEILAGANGNRLSNGDDPVHPACRARSSSSINSASLMSSDDLNNDGVSANLPSLAGRVASPETENTETPDVPGIAEVCREEDVDEK